MPDVPGKRTVIDRFLHWYLAKLNMAARYDMSAVMAFQKAKNLLAPPQKPIQATARGTSVVRSFFATSNDTSLGEIGARNCLRRNWSTRHRPQKYS
jgi:hypothetical protein